MNLCGYIYTHTISHKILTTIKFCVSQPLCGTLIYLFIPFLVPVEIFTKPQSYEELVGNPPHTFTIDFSGRQAQNMTIDWYKDGVPIDSSQVVTTYSPSQLSGTTELQFSNVRRSDRGVYRVVIRSEVGSGVFPREQTEEEISFQLDVQSKAFYF